MSILDLKLLNIISNSKKELGEFAGSVGENIFESKYRPYAAQILSFYRSYNSCPTLETLKEFCKKENHAYIEEIWNHINEKQTDPKEYGFYLKKISKRYNVGIVKQIAERAAGVNEENIESVNESIIKIANEIRNVDSKESYKEIELSLYVEEWKQKFIAKSKNPEIAQGIMTGFSMFDYYTNGIMENELWAIGGASNSGKSIFLINLAVNVYMGKNKMPETFEELVDINENNKWQKGHNILFISLEMSADEIVDRIISNMSKVNSLNVAKGIIKEWDVESIKKSLYYWQYSPNKIKIVDVARGCSIADINRIYETTCLEFKPDMIIIDYMGLMADISQDESNQDWLKLEKIAENLHETCRFLRCPIFTALQLTQSEEQGKAKVGFYRIARAKGIIRNLNGFLEIEDRENEYMRPDSNIHCLKFRRGPLFVMNNLRKEFQFAKFADMGFTPEKNNKLIGAMEKPNEDLSMVIDKIFGQDNNNLISE